MPKIHPNPPNAKSAQYFFIGEQINEDLGVEKVIDIVDIMCFKMRVRQKKSRKIFMGTLEEPPFPTPSQFLSL